MPSGRLEEGMGHNPDPDRRVIDPTSEGTRAEGRSSQDCPPEPDLEERHEWLEGYDFTQTEGARLAPETKNEIDRT
jgi:hypothetical protein